MRHRALKPSARCTCGSATLTMVASSTTMSRAVAMTSRARPRRLPQPAVAPGEAARPVTDCGPAPAAGWARGRAGRGALPAPEAGDVTSAGKADRLAGCRATAAPSRSPGSRACEARYPKCGQVDLSGFVHAAGQPRPAKGQSPGGQARARWHRRRRLPSARDHVHPRRPRSSPLRSWASPDPRAPR